MDLRYHIVTYPMVFLKLDHFRKHRIICCLWASEMNFANTFHSSQNPASLEGLHILFPIIICTITIIIRNIIFSSSVNLCMDDKSPRECYQLSLLGLLRLPLKKGQRFSGLAFSSPSKSAVLVTAT